jgi:hypothetical protein
MIKRIFLSVILIALFSVVFFSPSISASSFSAGEIISDGNFTNKNSMSESQIQNFLNSKNSVCLKNYTTAEPLGNNNYGGDVSAARAIWKSAQLYNINPQVLLVTLQKEVGLITSKDCAAWRYRTAMGFGCPDGKPCDSQWFGLSRQLFQAARHYRGFYDRPAGWFVPFRIGNNYIQWHPKSSCGGSMVYIKNNATASLYSYTPYQPDAASLNAGYGSGGDCSSYGNRNFNLYYSAWFGNDRPSNLIRTSNDATVYLKTKTHKYPIQSLQNLKNLAVFGPVTIVSQEEINNLDTGPVYNNLVRSPNGGLYFVTASIKMGFSSCSGDVVDYGYSCTGPFVELDDQLTSMLSSGPGATKLVKAHNDSTIYYMDKGAKRPIPGWNDLVSHKIPIVFNMLAADATSQFPTGTLLYGSGSLVKQAQDSTVYVVKDGNSLFPLTSFNITNELGTGYDLRTISASSFSKYEKVPNLSTKLICNGTYYVGTNKAIYPISAETMNIYKYTSEQFLEGGLLCQNLKKSTKNLSRYIRSNGTIYYVNDNGKKTTFYSYGSYAAHQSSNGNPGYTDVSKYFADSVGNN